MADSTAATARGARRAPIALVVLVLLGMATSACSRGTNEVAPAPTTVLTRPTNPPAVTETAPEPMAGSTTEPGLTSEPTSPTLPGEPAATFPVPTGVPGVDSEVDFCRAYVRFVGTLRVLGVAMSFGDLGPDASAMIEVVAAPATVVAAADALLALPPELEPDREVLADRVLGPLERRAEEAVSLLRAEGADDALLARLADVWNYLLATRDNTSFEVALPEFDEETDRVVAAAALVFADRRVPMIDDPAMVREGGVATPLVDGFVDEFCPEARAVTVGDEI